MKNVLFKSVLMAGFSGMLFVGCSNDVEDLYDPNHPVNSTINKYETYWRTEFGEIDQKQDWGFANATLTRTRYANTNQNQWADYVEVPADPTEAEISKVLDVFSKPVDQNLVRQINFSDFWVQHVYEGSKTYTTQPDMNGFTQDVLCELDQLQVAYVSGNDTINEHVNNFNSTFGNTMLMQASGTARFGYVNALDNGLYYYDYVILEIDGQYYVGFDYKCDNQNSEIEADGIYDDWIIKVVPAEYKNTYRIICEDLGTIGDFDFNDVVFDAYLTWDATVITVRAAGGTLPISVGGVEVHEAMGVETGIMVNTGGNSVNAPVAIFRIGAVSNAKDIAIEVQGESANFVLTAEEGKAPQKICVPTSFKWCGERMNIKEAYPEFQNWVNSKDENAEWYKNYVAENVMN